MVLRRELHGVKNAMNIMTECVGVDYIGLGPGVGVGDKVNEQETQSTDEMWYTPTQEKQLGKTLEDKIMPVQCTAVND